MNVYIVFMKISDGSVGFTLEFVGVYDSLDKTRNLTEHTYISDFMGYVTYTAKVK